MLSDVASSLSQRPSRNATEQLRSFGQRVTPQLRETHSHSQHTRQIRYQVTVIIVPVHYRIARRINCALSNDNDTRLPQLLLWLLHIPQYIIAEATECRVVIVTAPVAGHDHSAAPSRTTSGITTARTLLHYISRIKSRCMRT